VEDRGVRPSDELDAHDSGDAVHALAWLDGVPSARAPDLHRAGRGEDRRMAVIGGRPRARRRPARSSRRGKKRGGRRDQADVLRRFRPGKFYEKAGYDAASRVVSMTGTPGNSLHA